MGISNLFDKEEQSKIRKIVKDLRDSYTHEGIPKNLQTYLNDLATHYRLSIRIERQIKDYNHHMISEEEIATNTEIAELFKVDRSSITDYLAKFLPKKIYAQRSQICLNLGRKKGSKDFKKNRHMLTLEEKSKGGKTKRNS